MYISLIPASFSWQICRSTNTSFLTLNKPLGFSYVKGANRVDFPAANIMAFFNFYPLSV